MKKIVCAALLALAGGAHAQDTMSVRPFVGAGLTFGGDRLARVEFSDDTSSTLRAGNLFHFVGGLDFIFTPLISGQVNVGYHFDRASGDDGSLRFSRYPIETLLYYSFNEKFRLGGGARFISKAKLSGAGVLSGAHTEFDSTTGAVIEGEYFITPHMGIKGRYVSEEYKIEGYSGKIDGSHGGVYFNYYFF